MFLDMKIVDAESSWAEGLGKERGWDGCCGREKLIQRTHDLTRCFILSM